MSGTEVNNPVTDTGTVAPKNGAMATSTRGDRLRAAREAADMTQEQLGNLVGTTKQQISKLESGRRTLDIEWAERLSKALGISRDRLLFGRDASYTSQLREETDEQGRMVELVELDVRAAAGHGLEVEANQEIARWAVPRAMLEGVTTATPSRLRIITVYGDSMAPTFPPGARVMVDTEDRVPSPPGVFVVFDGLGLVVKRVEFLLHSDPPTIRLTSDNPRYASYERPIAEADIQGRVIGLWQWT